MENGPDSGTHGFRLRNQALSNLCQDLTKRGSGKGVAHKRSKSICAFT